SDGTIWLWDTARREEALTIDAHRGDIRSLAFSHGGQRFASGDVIGSVKVWDLKGRLLQALPGPGTAGTGLGWSRDGRLLTSASFDRAVKVWDPSKDAEAFVFRGHRGWVFGMAFSPDGRRLASAGHDGTVKVWDPATGAVALQIAAGLGPWLGRVLF